MPFPETCDSKLSLSRPKETSFDPPSWSLVSVVGSMADRANYHAILVALPASRFFIKRRWDWLLQAAWLWAGSWFGRTVRNVGWPVDGRKEEPQEQGHRYPLGWGKLGLYSHLREGFMVCQCVLSWGWGKHWTEWAFQSIHSQRILFKRLFILLHKIGHNTFSVQYLSSGIVT